MPSGIIQVAHYSQYSLQVFISVFSTMCLLLIPMRQCRKLELIKWFSNLAPLFRRIGNLKWIHNYYGTLYIIKHNYSTFHGLCETLINNGKELIFFGGGGGQNPSAHFRAKVWTQKILQKKNYALTELNIKEKLNIMTTGKNRHTILGNLLLSDIHPGVTVMHLVNI
jgi:hypothetical protein